jgi:hypothetical protein
MMEIQCPETAVRSISSYTDLIVEWEFLDLKVY